jgi:pSer/pThr/pTyr-binding forkhead associated (FHA) protein
VWVNGERVSEAMVLGRGDVLKVADEEFRFHGDAVIAPAARPALATLQVVSSGVMRGTTYEIRTPLAHIGRGAHNDIVLADESVSDTHAKLQRREDGWVVVDMGSTNGTYLGGRRIQGEQSLVGVPDVRFGGVKLIFRPAEGDGPAEASQTRAIAALKLDPKERSRMAPPPAASPTPLAVGAVASPNAGASAPDESRGIPIALWIVVLGVVGAGVLYFSMGR